MRILTKHLEWFCSSEVAVNTASLQRPCEENPFCGKSGAVQKSNNDGGAGGGREIDFCGTQRLLHRPQLSVVPWDELSFSSQGRSQVFLRTDCLCHFPQLRAGVSDVVPTWLSRPEGWFGSKQGQSGARTQPAALERRPHPLEPQDVDIRGPGGGEPFGERVMSGEGRRAGNRGKKLIQRWASGPCSTGENICYRVS